MQYKQWLHAALPVLFIAAAINCGQESNLSQVPGRNGTEAASGTGGSPGPVVDMGGEKNPVNGTSTREGSLSQGATNVTCENQNTQPVTLALSADDSNSMASPVYAREMLRSAVPRRPRPEMLRLSEFLNYYNVIYPYPVSKDPEVYLAAQPEPGDSNAYRFQAAVQAPDSQLTNPMVLSVIVDTSYSMKGEGMKRAIAALKTITNSLVPGDHLTVFTWRTEDPPLVDETITTDNKGSIVNTINGLTPVGGVDPGAALKRAYDGMAGNKLSDKFYRIVFISDGQASPEYEEELGKTIQREAKDGDEQGIYLVGVATGPAEGHGDALMNALTEAGRGAYVYLDSEEEAERVFSSRYREIMAIAARDVQVSITLPWYFWPEEIFAESASSGGEAVDPQHLGVGDSMIFNQIIHSCLPVDANANDTIDFTVTWQQPLGANTFTIARQATLQTLLASPDEEQSKGMAKANAIIAYAQALIDPSTSGRIDEAKMRMAVAQAAYSGSKPDPDLEEIDALLKRHPDYH